jgi:hypothetical protein
MCLRQPFQAIPSVGGGSRVASRFGQPIVVFTLASSSATPVATTPLLAVPVQLAASF